jgi:hypothetical protein
MEWTTFGSGLKRFPAPITLNIQYTTTALARYAALRLPLAH